MSSESQLNANRVNAEKSTGPKSETGKSIVSGNAIKHGATAKHFINQSEGEAYEAFLSGLQSVYPNNNPLVAMQLERIAKIKIQLERIQSTIDATFEMAQSEEDVDAKLMSLLNMDEALRKEAESIVSGETDISEMANHERIKVANELSSINIAELKTQQDFLTLTPQLCQYLFKRSRESTINIKDFIDFYAEIEVKKSDMLNKIGDALLRSRVRASEFDHHESLDEAIQQVSLENLRKAAKIYALEINRLSDVHYKITAFTRLREIPRLPIQLNLDTLDKLYRYQSTLQRQLSNCIGELLVLNKSAPLPREIDV